MNISMKYGDFSMKEADTLFMSVVKHPVKCSGVLLQSFPIYFEWDGLDDQQLFHWLIKPTSLDQHQKFVAEFAIWPEG